MTTEVRDRLTALARACSPWCRLGVDFDGLDLDLRREDLVPLRERPWPRWPTPWPGYRGDTAA